MPHNIFSSLRFRISLAATGVMLSGAIALMIVSWNRQRVADYWVSHTFEVEDQLSAFDFSSARARSWMRNYVLSKNPACLATYDSATTTAQECLDAIEELTRDNPIQQAQIESARSALAKVKADSDEIIHTAQTKGFQAALERLVSQAAGKDRDDLRALSNRMRGEEQALLWERQLHASNIRALSLVIQMLVSLIVFGEAVLGYWLFKERMKVISRERDALKSARDFSESIIATVREPLLILDSNLRIQSANRSFYLQFKTSSEKTVGLLLREISLGEWDIPKLFEQLDCVFTEHKEFENLPIELKGADLGSRSLQISGRKVYRPGNGTGLALLVIQDDTERISSEQRIQEINAELEGFSYSVAHDLRAPLRALRGFSDALIEDFGPQLDPKAREYAMHIAKAASRMDQLIRDLLDYSRLARHDIIPAAISLESAVTAARQQLAKELADGDAEIEIQSPLPWVSAHFVTLVQIISNLLSNAVKFVSPGVKPKVRVWAERRAGLVRLWFEDNGIGIAIEYQEKIFKVFERLNPLDLYPGSGIGLAIVRKGTLRQGGAVGVESELGKGSRFWIEFPAANEAG